MLRRELSLFFVVVCCLLAARSTAWAQDPDLEVTDNFNSGAEGWQIYDYDGGNSGNVFYPVTWQSTGGVANSGYVWGDDSRWRIDTPENPDSILSFIIYRSWVGESALDLRDAELSFYLRGDNLDLKGGNIYFWVLNSEPYGHRWHLTSQPLEITEGGWGEKQTVTLHNDPAAWHRSWTRSPLVPGTIDDILANVESYGFSFVGFSGEVTGKFSMDELELRAASDAPEPGVYRWQTANLGEWSGGSNWDWGTVPITDASVVFGIEATLPTTVVANSPVTAKAVQFDNSQSFAISGAGKVTLGAGAGNATVEVLQGLHQFQTEVALASDTDVSIAAGASLAFNNSLQLDGHDLTKTGAGTLQINNEIITDGGSVIGLAGMIGGSGSVSDDVFIAGAVFSPGNENEPGAFGIGGDYTQTVDGFLAIEIGSDGSKFDQLAVAGEATLEGALMVSLIDSGSGAFVPEANDTFKILSAAGGITGQFSNAAENLPSLAPGLRWRINYSAVEVTLSVLTVPEPNSTALTIVAAIAVCCWRRWPKS